MNPSKFLLIVLFTCLLFPALAQDSTRQLCVVNGDDTIVRFEEGSYIRVMVKEGFHKTGSFQITSDSTINIKRKTISFDNIAAIRKSGGQGHQAIQTSLIVSSMVGLGAFVINNQGHSGSSFGSFIGKAMMLGGVLGLALMGAEAEKQQTMKEGNQLIIN